jgi:hypothetical protein
MSYVPGLLIEPENTGIKSDALRHCGAVLAEVWGTLMFG